MIKDILIASIIGSFIGLDRTAIFQTMISQPIVTAPVIGFLLGDYSTGIAIGIALQLIWLFSLQIGAAIVFNSTLASVAITASTIEVLNIINKPDNAFHSIAAFSILVCLPFLLIEQRMDIIVRKINVFWVKEAEKFIDEGKFSAIRIVNLAGCLFFFLKNLLFLLASVFFMTLIISKTYPFLSKESIEGFALCFRLMPILGIAIVLESILIKRNYIYFFLGLFTALLFNFVL